jgi:hypothetical protein
LKTYPALKRNSVYRRMLRYLLAPTWLDEDTDCPVLSWEVLATIEGKEHQIRSRNYDGTKLSAQYQADTGHAFISKPHSYRERRAQIVTDLNLDPVLWQAW